MAETSDELVSQAIPDETKILEDAIEAISLHEASLPTTAKTKALQKDSDPPRPSRRPKKTLRKPTTSDDDDEPLIDTTAPLPLHSKKLERKQKRQAKKSLRTTVHSSIKSYLDLPPELLILTLSHLPPSSLLTLSLVNHATHTFIHTNESWIVREVISHRYPILSRCFQLPVPASEIDPDKRAALLSPRWQARIGANSRNPYQHVRRIDVEKTCCCSTCHLAWNNLCVLLDLAHWQHDLNTREPIPRIPRGQTPSWNTLLLDRHADLVSHAITHPLTYARILETHLSTIISTILRYSRYRQKGAKPPARLYGMTDAEAESGTDGFLAREGPSSYEFPFWRDNYYALGAYVPNRKWSKEEGRWMYPPEYPKMHEFDLEWASRWFGRKDEEGERRMDEYVERLRLRLSR